MSTWTKAEWATAALERLSVVAAGSAASAEDQAKAETKANSVFAMLRRRDLAPFDVATIPEIAQDPLEAILSGALASTFGVAGDRLVTVKLEAKQGMRDLAAVLAADPSPLPTEVDDF